MPATPYTLHRHLQPWRKAMGLTQEQLANKISSKISTISGWELGERKLDLADLERIAAAYGVHPALLLFAPPDSKEFEKLKSASELLREMPDNAARDWLALGQRLIPGSNENEDKSK